MKLAPQPSDHVQRLTAGVATLIFLAIALYVGLETLDNVLFFQKRMATLVEKQKLELDSIQRHWERQRQQLLEQADAERERIARESRESIQRAQQALDQQLDDLDAALDADLARLRQEQDQAAARHRETERRRLDEIRRRHHSALTNEEAALSQAETALGRSLLQYQEQLDRLRRLENQRDSHERTELRDSRNELLALESEAVGNGWERGPNGRYEPPNRPWYELWLTAWERWQNLVEKLGKAYDRLSEAELLKKRMDKQVEALREVVVNLQKEMTLWAGRVDECRNQVRAKEESLRQELAAAERETDEAARVARIRAEEDLLQRTRALRASRESRRQALRAEFNQHILQEHAEEERRAQLARRALERELEAWEREKSRALAAAGSAYLSALKPWQRSESARRLVGLLHGTVALYAFALCLRSLVRWLQLKGWCSEPYLVRTP